MERHQKNRKSTLKAIQRVLRRTRGTMIQANPGGGIYDYTIDILINM